MDDQMYLVPFNAPDSMLPEHVLAERGQRVSGEASGISSNPITGGWQWRIITAAEDAFSDRVLRVRVAPSEPLIRGPQRVAVCFCGHEIIEPCLDCGYAPLWSIIEDLYLSPTPRESSVVYALRRVEEALDRRALRAIELRHGVGPEVCRHTYHEVAENLGLSESRTKQVIRAAQKNCAELLAGAPAGKH